MAMTCHFVEDPSKATLVSCHVTGSQSSETEEYARLLDASITYMGRQSSREVLSVEQRNSNEEEKSSHKRDSREPNGQSTSDTCPSNQHKFMPLQAK